ncbi:MULTISPECIES: hypothetical protein [Lysinibacillus]|uniref:hypothetical protein n=1 Tax=Lysinibacillus TaxID=400634 RepID=UPI00214C328A|nr:MULTISPECIES: hypothetical protein [Lysinibacillus]UUV25860.1 hypothetical protein NP781_04390 [Lysinibacillus sp. FN11]UYB48734.1 hypothetical protein OCI51_07185 [Lysinibacillus capsici]
MKDYSNYHNINTGDKITHDALLLLNKTLDSYASYEVVVNYDKSTKILMNQKWDADGEAVKIIGHIADIERGNLIEHNGEYWLVVTKPEDNRIYRKAEARLCSAEFPVKYADQKVEISKDDLGRPVYKIIEGEVKMLPCVPKMNDASTSIADTNNPINLLDNQVMITIPYTEAPSIKYNEKFKLFNDTYRIIRIDPSKSINKVGVLRITGERVESVGDS